MSQKCVISLVISHHFMVLKKKKKKLVDLPTITTQISTIIEKLRFITIVVYYFGVFILGILMKSKKTYFLLLTLLFTR